MTLEPDFLHRYPPTDELLPHEGRDLLDRSGPTVAQVPFQLLRVDRPLLFQSVVHSVPGPTNREPVQIAPDLPVLRRLLRVFEPVLGNHVRAGRRPARTVTPCAQLCL